MGRKKKPAPVGLDPLMSRAQIAEHLGVCTRTLSTMISSRRFPGPDLAVGRQVRWKSSTVKAWVDAGEVSIGTRL